MDIYILEDVERRPMQHKIFDYFQYIYFVIHYSSDKTKPHNTNLYFLISEINKVTFSLTFFYFFSNFDFSFSIRFTQSSVHPSFFTFLAKASADL